MSKHTTELLTLDLAASELNVPGEVRAVFKRYCLQLLNHVSSDFRQQVQGVLHYYRLLLERYEYEAKRHTHQFPFSPDQLSIIAHYAHIACYASREVNK